MKYFGESILEIENGGTSADNKYGATIGINSVYMDLPLGQPISTMEQLNALVKSGTYKVQIQGVSRSVYLNPLLRAANGFRLDEEPDVSTTTSIGGSVLVFNTNNSSSSEFNTIHQIIVGDINGEYGIHYRSVNENVGLSRSAGFTGIDFTNTTKGGATTEEIKEIIKEVIPITEDGVVENAVTSEEAEKLSTPRSLIVDLYSNIENTFDGSSDIALGISGVLSTINGGTGNSIGKAISANRADRLTESRTLSVDLSSSNSGDFDGSNNVTIGVSGILPTSNGGNGGYIFGVDDIGPFIQSL